MTIAQETERVPNRFTGKHRGAYYYKGMIWGGPTNAIGQRTKPRAEFSAHSKSVPKDVMVNSSGLTKFVAGGQTTINTYCMRPGPFEIVVLRDGQRPVVRAR